jgi:hypothetical protein
MLSGAFDLLATKPYLARALGQSLCWIGSSGLLAGFLASSINRILAVTNALGGPATPVSYAQLLSPVPTWWVPEGFAGVLFYVTLLVLGYVLLETSRRLRHFLN